MEGTVEFVDWSRDCFNAEWPTEEEKADAQHSEYGHKLLKERHGRIVFSGTESESEGGKMEGAIMSGLRACNEAYEVCLGPRDLSMDAAGNSYRK